MRNVSKDIFLNTMVCPTIGWLARAGKVSRPPTIDEQFRMEQGKEIGRRARELYPEGVYASGTDFASAVQKTAELMDDKNVTVVFEGAFLANGLATRADVLERDGDGWHLIEVKSGVTDKKELIDDMAYTALIIGRAGYDITQITLMLVSKAFRLSMENESLFVRIDHTEDVRARVGEFEGECDSIEEVTRGPSMPAPKPQYKCRKCGRFKECVGKGIDNHIFEIPRLGEKKYDLLAEQGIFCVEEVPDPFPLTDNQARMKNCVRSQEVYIGGALKKELASILWPAFYLDFETFMTAIPVYPDIAPYTQLVNQYSVHLCSAPGEVIEHREYLADASRDCRRELAEQLVADLKGDGSIIVYSSFEKTTIKGLIGLFPDLSDDLNDLIKRLVDLEAIIRKNFYHPRFHGRTSIKKTLPALVPDMSYDDLDIGDGGTAMAVFAFLAQGKYDAAEAAAMREHLLRYCEQDTLAMVRLHERLFLLTQHGRGA